MAQNAAAVKARISKLDGQLLQSVGKELADLPEMLYDDEPIHAVASGLIDGRNWLLVVTDRRILLTYHGTLGGRQDLELPLSQVKSVSCKTGMLLGELLIDTGGQTKKIKSVQKVHARKVAEEVSRLLHAPKPAAATDAPAGDDTLTRLERLAALHEKGALTDEEFAAQKQAILAPAATVAVPEPAPATENPPAPEPASKTPPAQPQKKGGCVGKFLKIFGGIFVALLVLGLILDKFAPNKKGTPAPATEQTAPAAQQAPQTAPAPAAALTRQQAHAEVKALLKELDGFKATPMFKQCIYGCGDKNPATAWNARREVLHDQLAQQKDLPVMLKAAPGYLWSAEDAKRVIEEIEAPKTKKTGSRL